MSTLADLAWQDRARCRDMDLDLFFPEQGDPLGRVELAKLVCRTCPVRVECLEFALEREASGGASSRCGVWGGTSVRERERIARCRAGRCKHKGCRS